MTAPGGADKPGTGAPDLLYEDDLSPVEERLHYYAYYEPWHWGIVSPDFVVYGAGNIGKCLSPEEVAALTNWLLGKSEGPQQGQ